MRRSRHGGYRVGERTKTGRSVLAAMIAVLVLCIVLPRSTWGYIVFVIGVIWVCWFLSASLSESTSTESSQIQYRGPPPPPVTPRRHVEDDIPVPVATPPKSENFAIPSPPAHLQTQTRPGLWIQPRAHVVIADTLIDSGMIYVGTELKAYACSPDPCLINPVLSVAVQGHVSERAFSYWPSYTTITPAARRAYLDWLAGGRCDPEADIGYVFLFFYGLERRAIVDGEKSEHAKRDRSLIAQELRRLLAIYGDKSGSFKNYAGDLLNWLEVSKFSETLYNEPVPSFPVMFEVPLYIRLALGRAAMDKVPVPAHLALAWVRLDPACYLRTPATRCAEQFGRLFMQRYTDTFKPGIILPRNKTRLKLVYRPASAGFSGMNLTLEFGETPDVTVLTAPQKKLKKLVEEVTEQLEPYSRYLGRNPDASQSLEALLLLPQTLWPETAENALKDLQNRVADGVTVMKWQQLLDLFQANTTLNKERATAFANMLETARIGMVPDIPGGARVPKGEDHLVLYAAPESVGGATRTPACQMATLTLELACAVANADGEFSAQEMEHLRGQVQAWSHLSAAESARLLAYLHLLAVQPVSLVSLRKKLDALDAKSRETVAVFMATVAQADGTVTPAELKMLEKVYKTLGLDPQQVFTDVHAAAAGAQPQPGASAPLAATGFQLDTARIAALQKDSEQVGALLADIFKEESTPVTLAEEEDIPEEAPADAGLFGLDEAHSALARMLLSRPQWARHELVEVCSDLELMPDGALEHINEVLFDTHDIPFTEGDDPIDVNPDILEKLAA